MTIKKAIEILNQYSHHLDIAVEPDLVDAMKLGTAALGQFILLRKASLIFRDVPLPGETLE